MQHHRDVKSVYLGEGLRISLSSVADVSQESIHDAADRVVGQLEEYYRQDQEQLFQQVTKDHQRTSPFTADEVRVRIGYVVEGFTQEAIRSSWNLDIGLRAINTVTPGGILENQYSLGLIKEKTAEHPETAVYYADQIQKVLNPPPTSTLPS